MKTLILLGLVWCTAHQTVAAGFDSMKGQASWYGEEHRGKIMANGRPFDPTKLTAASWFYPLGTKVLVVLKSNPGRSVLVTITDRGPARRLVRQSRVIDLTRSAFQELASPELGVVPVEVVPLDHDVAESRSASVLK